MRDWYLLEPGRDPKSHQKHSCRADNKLRHLMRHTFKNADVRCGVVASLKSFTRVGGYLSLRYPNHKHLPRDG
jgi:hypothetical protein